MDAASLPRERYQGGDPRTRPLAAALAIAITLAIVWLLATLGLFDTGPSGRKAGALTTFTFATGQKADTSPAQKASKPKAKTSKSVRATPKPAIVPPTPKTPTQPVPWNVMKLGSDELAMIDTAMTTKHAARSHATGSSEAEGTGNEAGGGAGGDSRVVGKGPSGDALYAADWYTRPRDSELAFYTPHDLPTGSWGEIACRTIARYQVTDCVPLGESAEAPGYARKLVEAAWQFRVLPPRVNRHPLVGSWVRIRIEITRVGAVAG